MNKYLYAIVFFVLLFIAAIGLDNYFGKAYASELAINSNWVWSLSGERLDYIVMGSSRVKSGFNVMEIDSILHSNGLNIGEHGIGIAEQYLITSKFLRDNKAKYLILQVDNGSLNSQDYTYPFHEYNYFTHLSDPLVNHTVRDKTPGLKFYFWKYIPMFKYAEFNSEYVRAIFIASPQNISDAKGYVPIPKDGKDGVLNSFNASKNAGKKKALSKRSFGYFRYNETDSVYLAKLLMTAAQYGTKIILYTSPEHVDNDPNYVDRTVPDMIRYYDNLSAQYNVPYFHFFGSQFSKERKNISGDGLHLTYESEKVFSPMMADSLKKYMHL